MRLAPPHRLSLSDVRLWINRVNEQDAPSREARFVRMDIAPQSAKRQIVGITTNTLKAVGVAIPTTDGSRYRTTWYCQVSDAPGWVAAMYDIDTQLPYLEHLHCPDCHGRVTPRKSQYGAFFGCVRFPQCRGKLTPRQAEREIREYIGCDDIEDDDYGNGGDYDPGGNCD